MFCCALAGLLVACRAPSSEQTVSVPSPSPVPGLSPVPSPSPVPETIAQITEIQKQPVSVRPPNVQTEEPAKEGMNLSAGATIRTQRPALAHIDLKNGLGFRIGGDAVLTLQPDNRLNLTQGDMITWVEPGKKVPTEIVTPAAVAGIRGTTVFVKIPPDPKKEGILFFTWEGSVAVRLPDQAETLELKTGEEVRIRPGERDLRQIRRRIRRLNPREWQARLQEDRLLRRFRRPLPTQSIIERIKPGQVALPEG